MVSLTPHVKRPQAMLLRQNQSTHLKVKTQTSTQYIYTIIYKVCDMHSTHTVGVFKSLS